MEPVSPLAPCRRRDRPGPEPRWGPSGRSTLRPLRTRRTDVAFRALRPCGARRSLWTNCALCARGTVALQTLRSGRSEVRLRPLRLVDRSYRCHLSNPVVRQVPEADRAAAPEHPVDQSDRPDLSGPPDPSGRQDPAARSCSRRSSIRAACTAAPRSRTARDGRHRLSDPRVIAVNADARVNHCGSLRVSRRREYGESRGKNTRQREAATNGPERGLLHAQPYRKSGS